MRKLSKTGVLLFGALVSGCAGGEREPSVESTRQAVLSPELAASLACVETYVDAETCDWPHWSELWETCRTHEHPVLEDGRFLDAVQSGACTAANWPSLREQLVNPSPTPVRLRESCDATSLVIQEAVLDGCYSVVQGAGASFVEVPLGKTVTLHAGANCTGASVSAQEDMNLCETSFDTGVSADGNVGSFRIQDVVAPPSAYNYDCAPDELECVENYNDRRGAINKPHTVKLVRVVVPNRTTFTLPAIEAKVGALYTFFAAASRNQVSRIPMGTQVVNVPGTTCDKAKTQAIAAARSSAFMTVYMMPTGLCSASRARERSIFLNDNLFRSYAHEAGHVLSLAHGNTRDPATGDETEYNDASTHMGQFTSDNYNLPQLHWLGWTRKEEVVKVNAALAATRVTEVTLRPVDLNEDSPSGHKLGAVWESPDSKFRLFIAVPKSVLNGGNQIAGGTVIVYRAPTCKLEADCSGPIVMGTMTLARFVATNTNTHAVFGSPIKIKVTGYERKPVQVGGKTVDEYAWVKLQISQ
ncbi:lipoprotein [Myxococcus stipitatus DSM 14675]|uniref:Lipoprotein n=1 Tax=Myxococcus stipitatus (strain DSM 14675 / JCM 12634 / Mx s8) TaxID=1278073 RepID=L7UC31_MYXSD|nr:hypothetical protein [Myxococcus stipitatus]AGC44019.1 lipoprotein [Myxococcus stipitatus DSM 14675]